MQVLVFNVGSSSLKFGVFNVEGDTHEVFKGSYERFRDGDPSQKAPAPLR